MTKKIRKDASLRTTINEKEIRQFDILGDQWWDESGPMKPLHQLNPLRLDYIKRQALAHFGLKPGFKSLQNLKIADIGCGGGIVAEPLCRMCLAAGLLNDGGLTAGGEEQRNAKRRHLVCDHIVPHRGDVAAFWRGPFQTLCPDHHDRAKQIEETKGFSVAVGGDGWPIDPGHPANR